MSEFLGALSAAAFVLALLVATTGGDRQVAVITGSTAFWGLLTAILFAVWDTRR